MSAGSALLYPLPRHRLAAPARHHPAGAWLRPRVPGDERRGRRSARGGPDAAGHAVVRHRVSAGVLGAWTLPQVAVGFLATVAVLALDRRLRVPALVGLVASVAAIAAWYAPHVGQVQAAAAYPDGRRIHTAWLLTAPFDQILSPGAPLDRGRRRDPGCALAPPRARRNARDRREPARASPRSGARPHGGPGGHRPASLDRALVRHPALRELPARADVRPPRDGGCGDPRSLRAAAGDRPRGALHRGDRGPHPQLRPPRTDSRSRFRRRRRATPPRSSSRTRRPELRC